MIHNSGWFSIFSSRPDPLFDEERLREGAEKKKKNKWWNFHHTGGGSLIFHHFPSFQQFFFLASKWPNSSRNAKKKISIFGDPPSYSASSQAFYVKILNIWLKNFWKKHLLQNLLKAWSWCQKELLCIFHHWRGGGVKTSMMEIPSFVFLFFFCAFPKAWIWLCLKQVEWALEKKHCV